MLPFNLVSRVDIDKVWGIVLGPCLIEESPVRKVGTYSVAVVYRLPEAHLI